MTIYLTAKRLDSDGVLTEFRGYNTESLENNCINSQRDYDKNQITFALNSNNHVFTEVFVKGETIRQEVHLVCDNDIMYLRTDHNHTKVDNLDFLPDF